MDDSDRLTIPNLLFRSYGVLVGTCPRNSINLDWKIVNDFVLIIADHAQPEAVPVGPDWEGAVSDARKKIRTTTVLA